MIDNSPNKKRSNALNKARVERHRLKKRLVGDQQDDDASDLMDLAFLEEMHPAETFPPVPPPPEPVSHAVGMQSEEPSYLEAPPLAMPSPENVRYVFGGVPFGATCMRVPEVEVAAAGPQLADNMDLVSKLVAKFNPPCGMKQTPSGFVGEAYQPFSSYTMLVFVILRYILYVFCLFIAISCLDTCLLLILS